MESQFPHIEGYGRRASTRKKGGRSMEGVAHEAERRPSHCKHVSEPKPPKILFGCKPSEAVCIAAERAAQAVDADGNKLRIDGLVFLGGVASFPAMWTKIREDKAEKERLRRWLGYLIEHLKAQYGVTLHYALLHFDEPYPHVHWGCVPELEADRRMRISTVHPGRAAYDRARAADGNNAAGRRAYQQAMKEWQDDFHLAVYAKVGIARVGPRRQRLTASEYKARQQAAEALARTLAAERELKAKWREDIRAEVSEELSSELMYWKRQCTELIARLATANGAIVELKARVAELEARFEPPIGARP
jgi:Plasmid recombination enzyme